MDAARQSKRWLAALLASTITVVDVHAAVTDIYSQPLATTSTVVAKPNIMFILDNSGSMARAYMPDDMDDTDKYGYWSSQCNGVAFDPTLNYPPPVKADGTSYPDASFTNGLGDGFAFTGNDTVRSSSSSRTIGTGSMTFSLSGGSSTSFVVGDVVAVAVQGDGDTHMIGSVTAWDSTNDVLTLNITSTTGSGSYNSWYVSRMLSLSGSTYYTYNATTGDPAPMSWTYNTSGVITSTPFYQQCMSDIGSSPGSGKFTLQTVTTASTATLQQNYANWHAYYRTRRLLMRTATGRAFQALDNKFRVGFSTISDTGATQGTNKFLDIGDFDTAKKTDFYKSLYTADGNASTPLLGALTKAGRYFANKAPGQASDPMQYSCQRNYAILSTDGYWNSVTSSYGPHQLTSNTEVGQQDGTEAKPMHDGASAVNTTTNTTSTVTQQQVDSTTQTSTTYRRYKWVVGNTLTNCGGNNNRYIMSIQEQRRTTTTSAATSVVQNVTTNTVQTIVTTNGVETSNTTAGPTTTTSTVSSTSTPGAGSVGDFADFGTPVAGCASQNGLNSVGLNQTGGITAYSTTSDTSCTTNGSNTCNYNSTSSGTNTGGSVQSGPSTTTLSGPTITVLSGPTTTNTSTSVASSTGGASSTLADVAEYYYKTDLRTSALGNCTGNGGNNVCANDTMLPMPPLDTATHQHMTTYTVGLGVNGTLTYDPNYLTQASGSYVQLKNGTLNWPDPNPTEGATRVDDLWHAAVNGRGRYFATQNATTLANALSSALSDATKAIGSAAGAATNSLEPVLGDNNKAYIATYTTIEWSGDIKAFPLDAATGNIDTSVTSWSAKAQLNGVSAGSRAIKYMQPGTKAMRSFTYSNLNADGFGGNFTNICSKSPAPLQCGTLSAGQISTANDGNNLVNFLRGDETYEAETNLSNPLYRERAAKLGDIVNSSPVYVKKSNLSYNDTGHAAFVASTVSRKGMLYAGSNDGMLHAFDATNGNELWAFVPSFVMPQMYKLADTDYRDKHRYFVDGSPVVGDIYTGSTWKTILVGGLNSGGKGYYALDITDPDNPTALWEFTDTNMGLTYGNPVITKRTDGTWVVAVSSGLNNADGEGRIYLINAASGALVTSMSTATGSATTPSGLSKINAWISDSTDNTAKRFYGGDMLGNLWRFDFEDLVAPSGAEVTKLANFSVSGTPQPITTKPQLTVVTASGGTKVPVVVVATGRCYGTSDVSDTAVQSIYAVKDPLTGTGWGDARTRTDIVNQTVTVSGITGTGTNNAVDWSTKIGWMMDLPQSKERVVTDFLLQFNVLTVASAIPGSNECNPSGGSSWIYEMNVGTGTSANGTTVSSYLGAYLVVGMSSILATDGALRQIIVGSDATVHTRKPAPPIVDANTVRRSAWRELIN